MKPRSSLVPLVLLLAVSTSACGGKRAAVDGQLLGWAQALQIHFTTDSEANYTMPERLGELDPELTQGLDRVDPWGMELFYRQVQDDRYQLISAGPDSTLGNEDDVVIENGVFKDAAGVYAERPLRR